MLAMGDIIDVLEMTGLTRTEAKIYVFLIQHGANGPSVITRGVQLHRRTVYDVINRLSKKGVVSTIVKNNRMQYEAVAPKRIQEMLAEKASALQDV